jgi:hypothetical protein
MRGGMSLGNGIDLARCRTAGVSAQRSVSLWTGLDVDAKLTVSTSCSEVSLYCADMLPVA